MPHPSSFTRVPAPLHQHWRGSNAAGSGRELSQGSPCEAPPPLAVPAPWARQGADNVGQPSRLCDAGAGLAGAAETLGKVPLAAALCSTSVSFSGDRVLLSLDSASSLQALRKSIGAAQDRAVPREPGSSYQGNPCVGGERPGLAVLGWMKWMLLPW